MSRRNYTIRKAAGDHLTFEMRQILGQAWNNYLNRSIRISLRKFAEIHNISYETWRREYARGAAHKPIRNGNKWIYAEYDAVQAQTSITEGKSNMGAKMKLTMPMAIIFRYYVLIQRRSPYDARQYVIEALPGREVPCLRTFYNHIEAGDMGVFHGGYPLPSRQKTKTADSGASREDTSWTSAA